MWQSVRGVGLFPLLSPSRWGSKAQVPTRCPGEISTGIQLTEAAGTHWGSWHTHKQPSDDAQRMQGTLRRQAPHLTMAQGLLSQRQETRRTTCLNLLAGVCNSGHCGVCHATFQYTKQKTEHLWRQTRITNSGSLRKIKGMVQRQRLRGYRETGPHCSCLGTETSITCTTASANQMHTTCTHTYKSAVVNDIEIFSRRDILKIKKLLSEKTKLTSSKIG